MISKTYKYMIYGTLALCGALLPRPALAAATPWVDSDYSQVRLIAAWHGDEGLRAGLQFRLEAGWKTYWRSPGDSGIPTRVDWSGSRNTVPPVLRHPIPRRVETFGFQTLVYENQVVLPVQFAARQAGSSVRLSAKIDYAVCKDICVPLHAELSLDIDSRAGPGAADKAHARLIERYAALVPSPLERPELAVESVRLSGPPGRQSLRVEIASAKAMSAPGLIVEAPPPFAFGAPVFARRGNQTVATIGVGYGLGGSQSNKSLAGQRVVLTIYDGDVGIERTLVVGLSQ